jgi:uncharacterized coiled-coil protein SlyX
MKLRKRHLIQIVDIQERVIEYLDKSLKEAQEEIDRLKKSGDKRNDH